MTAPSRFQPVEPLGTRGAVHIARGVDTLTGLPVRMYTFPTAPLDASHLESEHVPGVLASGMHEGEGYVIVAHAADYRPLDRNRAKPELLVDAAQALRDAAEAGVPHGDLRPDRLLEADGHVLIEGYGVPWEAASGGPAAAEATNDERLSADIAAFAAALLAFDRGDWPAGMRTALEEARDAVPSERPSARELHARLRDAARAAPPAQRRGTAVAMRSLEGITLEQLDDASGRGDPADLMQDFDFDLGAPESERSASSAASNRADGGSDDPSPPAADGAGSGPAERPPAATGPGSAPVRPGARAGSQAPGKPGIEDPDPIAINSDPDPDTMRLRGGESARPSAPDAVFVKDVPPGATYRAGDAGESAPPAAFRFESDRDAAPSRTRRRFVAIAAILAVAVVVAIVMLPRGFGPRGDDTPPVLYTVEIAVVPASIPRVDLLVVSSPDGSAFGPGDVLDTVPGQVLLDAEGEWVLRGRYQGRTTDTVRLVVPVERRASLVVEDAVRDTTP